MSGRERLFEPVEIKRLESGGLKVLIKRFRLAGLSAVLFILQTPDPVQPWILETVKVARAESGEPLPFALYNWPTPPGPLGTRRVVVVMRTSPKGGKEPILVQLHEPCAARQLWYMSPYL
jgi:hypothetical protein